MRASFLHSQLALASSPIDPPSLDRADLWSVWRTMPRQLLLFCLVSSQLAVTAVMARQFPLDFVVVFDGGAVPVTTTAADAPFADLRARSLLMESALAGSPLPLGLSHHHGARSPFDRTFTGGKIILAGLAAAIVAAVFCYIRITRAKKNTLPKS